MTNASLARRSIVLATLVALSAGVAASAFAADTTTWQKNHPRRAEVNGRLANQDKRIHNEVKSGEISKTQAAALHAEDHSIRTEERSMAALNGGHITKAEKHALNQQENTVSKQIGK